MQRLGQHFLNNQHALKTIVDTLQIATGDTIIEIGPGHGELTNRLLASSAEYIMAIEKDLLLAHTLKNMIQDSRLRPAFIAGPKGRGEGGQARFIIHEGDALRLLPVITHHLKATNYKLVGNIPYYITGSLFRLLGILPHKPSCAVFTIQKEVAERICETPPRMNRFAATVQIWAEPNIIMTLAPHDFDPPPKVDSAIIILKIMNHKLGIMDTHHYYTIVRTLFAQPRKTIINNLISGFPKTSKDKLLNALAHIGVSATDRPHDLSVQHIQQLSLQLCMYN